jgi:phenylalanyl-tRNA synthetase beta chain
MRVSRSWLREYIRLPETPEKVADALTMHAFEASVVPAGSTADLHTIRVGEVRAVRKHPNADRLSVVNVTTGKDARDLVTGAPNVRAGMKVAVAFPGSSLLSKEGTPAKLSPAVIRGVKSVGMLCSARELGLGDDHAGILELPASAKVGTPLSRLFPPDVLFDVDVLPNRAADAQSHIGVARELGAILRRETRLPRGVLPKTQARTVPFHVTVEDRRLCPRYIAILLDDVQNGPSPLWMQARLRTLGVRPQNLIVDVTNYVLLDTGQPLHAFHAPAVAGALAVRHGRKGERLTTLDDVERSVPDGALVITSDDRPAAFAGIMGGEGSGIRADTTRVVLEAALFDRGTIRKTAEALGLRTDASDRFSRGLTQATVEAGAARAIELLTTLGGARVVGIRDVAARPPSARPIVVRHDLLEAVLGMRVPSRRVRSVLSSLGFRTAASAAAYRVVPPPFRIDMAIPEDVIEEVGRIIGYDVLPSQLPAAPVSPAVLPEDIRGVRRVQDALKAAGWTEAYTYSFMPEEEALALRLHRVENLIVVNPMNRDQARLRTSLLPNLLHVAGNAAKREPVTYLFEVGRVYPANGAEELHVAGMLVRRSQAQKSDAFFDVKGVVEHVLEELDVADVWFDATEPSPEGTFLSLWEPGRVAEIQAGDAEAGIVGAVSAELLERLRIRGDVIAFELNLSRLLSQTRAERIYAPPFPYPVVRRDLSLRVPAHVLVDEISKAIERAGAPLVQDVDFVDLYDPSDTQKGVTLRITYGSKNGTLTDGEVNDFHQKVTSAITAELGVEERN